MAGPGAGEARIVVEMGQGRPRYVSRVRTGSRPADAATLLEALPALVAEIESQLQRSTERERVASAAR
jgi:hypothetical protein